MMSRKPIVCDDTTSYFSSYSSAPSPIPQGVSPASFLRPRTTHGVLTSSYPLRVNTCDSFGTNKENEDRGRRRMRVLFYVKNVTILA